MATEYKRIILRKGLEAQIPVLADGELGFTTDTNKLFIGTASQQNKEIPVENIILSDITDVSLTNIADGDILKYSTTSGNWENEVEQYVNSLEITTVNGAKILTIGLNGGTSLSATLTNVLPLDALAGVVITEGVTNDVLQHNGTNWVDAPLNMEQLGNVSVSSDIANGEILKWNATAGQWENDGDTDTTIKVDTFGFETNTYNLQLQQTAGGNDFSVDFAPVLVKNFALNTAAPAYQIDLTLQDDTVLTADLLGLRNSDVNSLSFNTNNDGVLTIGTVGGSTYTADLDGRYLTGTHTHGFITNDGKISGISGTNVDINVEDGDQILIINSGSGNITTSDITFDGSTTNEYLNKSGDFSQPAVADISGLSTALGNKSDTDHTHGLITNDGAIDGQGAGIGTNDHLVISKPSNDNKLSKTTIQFDLSQSTKYLSQDGTFSVPSFTPGNYVETDVTELTNSGTYAFSNFSSYDKLIAVLYSDPNASFNTSAGVSDTVEIRQALQLHFETYVDNTNGTCYVNGEPTLAQNQQECELAGGTWVGTTFTSTGKVNFQPGGKIERISSTNVQFTQPTAVNGHTWKLKIIGVTF